MSEYQYYEFCRINGPLSKEIRQTMHSLSSRAQVGTHGASYVYNYGDFRGNPKELLLKYFDVFFYISNFGTIQLMFKYSPGEIEIDEVKKYCIEDVVNCEVNEQGIVLTIDISNEDGFGWTDGEGLLPTFLPLYDEIKAKNYQFLELVSAVNDRLMGAEFDSLNAMIAQHILSSAQRAFLDSTNIGR